MLFVVAADVVMCCSSLSAVVHRSRDDDVGDNLLLLMLLTAVTYLLFVMRKDFGILVITPQPTLYTHSYVTRLYSIQQMQTWTINGS